MCTGVAAEYVTVAVTDTRPIDLPETSYDVCAVVPSRFTGLARCHLADVRGRYVFVKAPPKTNLKLCEVEVYPYRECNDNGIATARTLTHAHTCAYARRIYMTLTVTFSLV